jgi:hypothetical protein
MEWKVVLSLILIIATLPQLLIAVDDSRESKFITIPYERGFQASVPAELQRGCTTLLYDMDLVVNRTKPNVKIIRWDDIEAREKYRVPNLPKYPQYKLGYGEWHEFPRAAFRHPFTTVEYIEYIQREFSYEHEVYNWTQERNAVELYYYTEYIATIFSWHEQKGMPIRNGEYDECYQDGEFCGVEDMYTATVYSLWHRVNTDPNFPLPPAIAHKPRPVLKNPLEKH